MSTVAFYIFGISEFQDMLPMIIETSKRTKCWVCLFDCVYAKRQFENYESQELLEFVKRVFDVNNVEDFDLNFYGPSDEHVHTTDYAVHQPKIVVIQSLRHKYPTWYPVVDKAKLALLAWGSDSFQCLKQVSYHYNPQLVILRNDHDKELYSRLNMPGTEVAFFGEIRKTALAMNPVLLTAPDLSSISRRTCLISETWIPFGGASNIGGTSDEADCSVLEQSTANLEITAKLTDAIFEMLWKHNFYIVWKRREKGQPPKGKKHWQSPLEGTTHMPDYVIDRDLNFPTTLISIGSAVDLTLVINLSTAYYDLLSVNKNSFMFDAAKDHNDILEELDDILTSLEPVRTHVDPAHDILTHVVDKVLSL